MPTEHHPKICLECGKPIILGAYTKTCSEKCRRERLRKQKRVLYEKYRETDEFKQGRAEYLEKLKARHAADPELNAAVAAARKTAVKRAVKKRNADPVRREEHLAKANAWKAGVSDEQKEKMRAANRAWRAKLSPEQKAKMIADSSEKRRQRRIAQKGAGDRVTNAGPGTK